MRKVRVLLKEQAHKAKSYSVLPGARILILCSDYELRRGIIERFGRTTVLSKSGLFNKIAAEVRGDFVKALSEINKHAKSFWWGGQISSKSTSATSLFARVVFFFIGLKYLSESSEDLFIVVDNPQLGQMLECEAEARGIKVVHNFAFSVVLLWFRRKLFLLLDVLRAISFGLCAFSSIWRRRDKRRDVLSKLKGGRPKILLRTWVMESNFVSDGFKERIFGPLAHFLKKSGKDVFFCPMFSTLVRSEDSAYKDMLKNGVPCFRLEHFVSVWDVFSAIWDALRIFYFQVRSWNICQKELKPLLEEASMLSGMERSLFILNLQGKALPFLQRHGVTFESIIYPFESNSSEKPFLLDARRAFPQAQLIGFAHTTFFREQASYFLSPGEEEYHPLPHKIITNGKKHLQLFREANFPEDILYEGSNLRFEYIHRFRSGEALESSGAIAKSILVPLTFSHELAFDVFDKLKAAMDGKMNYTVFVRPHPLLDKKKLEAYLRRINLEFSWADEGSFIEWARRVSMVVVNGGTLTTLEAVFCEVPVIRLIPDLYMYYDSYHNESYPLAPAESVQDLCDRLRDAERLLVYGRLQLKEAAEGVVEDYFNIPNQERMALFLSNVK